MSDPRLLQRIQHGRTQNANKCLNGQIWAWCPKTVHVGADRVNAAVASAVSNFNQGRFHLSQVMNYLGVTPTAQLQEYKDSQDRKRCKQAEIESEPARNTHVRTKVVQRNLRLCAKRGRRERHMVQVCCEPVRTIRREGVHTK